MWQEVPRDEKGGEGEEEEEEEGAGALHFCDVLWVLKVHLLEILLSELVECSTINCLEEKVATRPQDGQ